MTIEEKIKERLAYYKEQIKHCSVFTTEYALYNGFIKLLKGILNDDD